jgi:hypothetical protein
MNPILDTKDIDPLELQAEKPELTAAVPMSLGQKVSTPSGT